MAAYVAFDLDNTLGWFELTNIFSYFWSPEILPQANHPQISPRLKTILYRTRKLFAESLLKRRDLLFFVLRPSLKEWIPLLKKAYKDKVLKKAIIYSNTSNNFSMELAKHLIEHHFRIPGFFSVLADIYHPLRAADYPLSYDESYAPYESYASYVSYGPTSYYIEPIKQYDTLVKMFKPGPKENIKPSQVLFLDDRYPKHKLENMEPYGLTYLVVDEYRPKVTKSIKKDLVNLALTAIKNTGLLSNTEYLQSDFCMQDIRFSSGVQKRIRGFPDLLTMVMNLVDDIPMGRAPNANVSTDMFMANEIQEFLRRV
jgi:hypothetical protein